MGRSKKKKKNRYKNNSLKNIGLIILITLLIGYIYSAFKDGEFNLPEVRLPHQIRHFNSESNRTRLQEQITTDDVMEIIEEVSTSKKQVKIFFISNMNGKDFYNPVYRENNTRKSDIEYAIRCLFDGPTYVEQNKGVYSEIPQTKINAVRQLPDRVVIDLQDSFGQGGGADSLYKRMYQLIKTVNYNTKKPVYLLINGRFVDAIGGEGLMLKQPLNEDSLDD